MLVGNSFVVTCCAPVIMSFAEVLVAESKYRCCSDSKALKLADHVINTVRNDPHAIRSLQELRTQFLKHPSPHSNHARATAVKYFHHFAAVRGVTDAGSGSLEHRELLDRVTWIDLKLPEPPLQRRLRLFMLSDSDSVVRMRWSKILSQKLKKVLATKRNTCDFFQAKDDVIVNDIERLPLFLATYGLV